MDAKVAADQRGTASSNALGSAIDRTEASTVKTSRGFNSLVSAYDKSGANALKAEKAMSALFRQIDIGNGTAAQHAKILEGIVGKHRITVSSAELAARGYRGLADAAANMNVQQNQTVRAAARASQSVDGMASTFRGAAAQVAAAMAAIGGAALIGSIAKAGLEMDSLERGFAAAAGSAEQGAREFMFIRDTADRLGLSLGDTSKQYLGFLAASRGTALQGKDTRDVFVAVSSAMGVLGKGTEETGRALTAVQQMMSKGKVSAEEMTGQLGEALPGALTLSAKAMGMTQQALLKVMGDGKLLASDLLPKLARELQATYGEAAAKASQGLQANLNRASTAWLDYRDTIARNGLNDALSRSAGDMAAFLNDNKEAAAALGRGLGATVDWFRALGAAAVEAYDSAKVILQMIGEADKAGPATLNPRDYSGQISDLLSTALEFDKAYINGVIGVFAAGYEMAVAAWNGLPAAFGGFGAAAANALISAVEGAVNLTISGFNKVVDAINGIGANVPGFSNLAKAAEVSFGRIEAAGESTVGKLGSELATIGKEAMSRDYLGEIGQRYTDLKTASAAAREERKRLADQVQSDKVADALRNTGDGAAKAAQDLDAAGKAAKAAAKEFETLKSTAEQAFKIAFPEEALRKQGQELQAQLDKYRDKLAAIDPRYVDALEMKIRLNLDGKELESVKDKTHDLSKEMSRTFAGIFDDMFSNGKRGFDGLFDSLSTGFARIGTRQIEQRLITPLIEGKGLAFDQMFDFSKYEKAFSGATEEGAKTGLSFLTEMAGSAGSVTGLLGGGLGALAIGYKSKNPVMGALAGGIGGFNFNDNSAEELAS